MIRNLEILQKKVNDVASRRQTQSDTDGDKRRKIREFKQPEHDNNIEDISRKKFAPQSKQKIMWAVNLYNQWRENRMSNGVIPVEIVNANLDMTGCFNEKDLSYSLSKVC